MFARNFLIASGTLLSLATATPIVDRDIVWHTDIVETIVTIPVTVTVWVNSGEYSAPPVPTTRTHFGHHNPHTTSSSTLPSSTTIAAANPPPPASTSSVVVAPSSTPIASAPAESSQNNAPVVVSSSAPAAVPVTVPAPSSDNTSAGGSGLSGGMAAAGTSYTGEVTWYQTGMGACGWTNTASEHIVAVSKVIFDSYSAAAGGNSNNNPVCGKYVNITGKDGAQYTAKVVDRCVGCVESDLDLSEEFFKIVTSNGDGRVGGVTWAFA